MFIGSNDLVIQESTNSRTSNVICTRRWPCRRLTCKRCYVKRRGFFVYSGLEHIKSCDLDTFLTLSWIGSTDENVWGQLLTDARMLFKAMSGKMRWHYIRVLSVGVEKRTPHIHIILGEAAASVISKLSKSRWPESIRLNIKQMDNPHGLLGYVFDQNYKLGFLDQTRPKGVRLLTASRPMETGFPTGQQLKKLWSRVNE